MQRSEATGLEDSAAHAPSLRMDIGLLLVSAAILTHEVLETKIFAYSLDSISIYLAISVCLMGLGASATILAVLPPIPASRTRSVASLCAASGAVAVIFAHLVFARFAPVFAGNHIMESRGIVPESALVLVALMSPYLCFGAVVALILSARPSGVSRTYAFNLAGSALGCLLVFPVLDALGAERALGVVAGLSLAGAICFAPRKPGYLMLVAGLGLALVAFFNFAERLLVFPPEPLGQLRIVEARVAKWASEYPGEDVEIEHIYKRWDRTARVDVYRLSTSLPKLEGRPVESLFFVQDSSAGSHLLGTGAQYDRAKPFFERTMYGLGYALGHREDVLVIGLGGAPDVMTAIYYGAGRIEAVDINGAAIDLVREHFAEYLGSPYAHPAVGVHQVDGRTFLRQHHEPFDLIQMTGVDTKAVFAAGSLSVNENYIHTREAFVDLLTGLKPDGVLVVNRFSDEALYRMTNTAADALAELGVEDPRPHMFAAKQGAGWRGLLVKRSPLTPREVRSLNAWSASTSSGSTDVRIPAYSWIGLPLNGPIIPLYSPPPVEVVRSPFFKALAEGELERYIENAFLDLSSTVDDRPYFFFYERPLTALQKSLPWVEDDRTQWSAKTLRFLHGLLLQLATISAIFIVAPLFVARRRGLRAPGVGRSIVYFICLGAGFMFAEIGLIQRFVLLLGHQSYAVTVVLLGLLVGASLGSLLSNRLRVDTPRPLALALAGVACILAIYGVGLNAFFDLLAGADFGLRLAISLAVVVVLGIGMGIPFPTALRALGGSRVPFIAWAVAVNSFASVIASTLSLEIAMLVGLRVLIAIATSLYLLAIFVSPLRSRASAAGA